MQKPNVIAVIPARSGSKGIKDKNILELDQITLIGHAVEFAKLCPHIGEIVISTDSPKYEEIARSHGATSLGLRPSSLSKDDTKTIDVIIDILSRFKGKYQYILVLQPTSPIRRVSDFVNIYNNVHSGKFESGVSIARIDDPHPFKLKSLTDDHHLTPFIANSSSETPRQLLPTCYSLSGGLYLARIESTLKFKTLLPSETYGQVIEHPHVNVDNIMDYKFLKFLVESEKVGLYD